MLGEVDRVSLISPERLREVSAVAMSGTNQIFGFPTACGLGYSIGQFISNAHETRHVFGVGGVGGSHAYADTATGTTFALTKNRLAPSFDTGDQVAGIVTEAVANSEPGAQRTPIQRGELTLMAPAGTYVEANGLQVYYEVHGGTATSQSWASRLPASAKHALSRVGQVPGPRRHAVQEFRHPSDHLEPPPPLRTSEEDHQCLRCGKEPSKEGCPTYLWAKDRHSSSS